MSYNSKNFLNSETYQAYADLYKQNLSLFPFEKKSPYVKLKQIATNQPTKGSEFYNFGPVAIGSDFLQDTTYYSNGIAYMFVNYVCGDPISNIKNKNLFFEDFKVPLNYYTNGELFGIKKRFDSIKTQIPLKEDSGWSFFEDFDTKRKISSTDDIEKILENIFYNTYFNFFNVSGFFKSGIKIQGSLPYTKKGKVETQNLASGVQADKYTPGKGEAPNFLDVSANAYQKNKNKVLIKASAVRTSYTSNNFASKQVYFNDTKEDFLSGFVITSIVEGSNFVESTKQVKNGKDPSFFFSSLSDKTTLDIIQNFVYSTKEYFNLVQAILKDAIISYEFFKRFATEEDIFNTAPGLGNVEQKKLINEVKVLYKDQELISSLALYIKELIINLLNIVGDEDTVKNACNLFIDYLQETQPQITQLYVREELLNVLFKTNLDVLRLYSLGEPKTKNYPYASVDQNIQTISFEDKVVHSNDLIMQDILVYRTLEKPLSFDDILQESNLYKTIKLATKNNNIVQSSASIIDDIENNKKYYYCFLSQREYDIYTEIFPNLKLKNSRKVKHLSSPTKILELEMISTDNSTYLDYNFFVPEIKEFSEKTKNFLSKFKILPSAGQKIYDQKTKNFFFDKENLIKLWTKTEKPINSNDLSTGSTIKLRLSSPKTNRKLDINIRYFLNDQINFGDQFKEIKDEDIKNISNSRKYYQVFSALQPEIKNSLKESKNNNLLDITADKKIQYKLDSSTDIPKFYFLIDNLFSQTEVIDPNNPPIQDYLKSTSGLINIYFSKNDKKNLIGFKDVSFIGGNKDISDLSKIKLDKIPANLENVTNLSLNKILIEQSIIDLYKFNYNKQNILDTEFKKPKILSVTTEKKTVNEGEKITFIIKTENISDNTKLDWELQYYTNPANSSDFVLSKSTTAIFNNIAYVEIEAKKDILVEGLELFWMKVSKSFGYGLDSIEQYSDNITIVDTTPTFKIGLFWLGSGLGQGIIDEGGKIQFNVNTTNFPDGKLNWTITGPGTVTQNFIEPVQGEVQIINGFGSVALTTVNNAAKQGDKTFNFVLLAPTGNVLKSFTIKDNTVVQTQTSTNPNVTGTAQQQLPASNQAQAGGAASGGAAFASGPGAGLPAGVGTPASQPKPTPVPSPTPQPTPTIPKCGFIPEYSNGIIDSKQNDKTYLTYKKGIFNTKLPTGTAKLAQGQVVVLGKLSGGNVYGSSPYTSDSDWGMAAVHAGLINPGETAIIQFSQQGELPGGYISSYKFGVTTKSYDKLWCGFKISLVTLVN